MLKPNRATRIIQVFTLCLLVIGSAIALMAQTPASADQVVPSMVKYSGFLSGTDGKALTGTQGVTFLLYKEETGGAPLWMETQNVQADNRDSTRYDKYRVLSPSCKDMPLSY